MKGITFDRHQILEVGPPVLRFTATLEDDHGADRSFAVAFDADVEREPVALTIEAEGFGEIGAVEWPDAMELLSEIIDVGGYVAAITYEGPGWGGGAGTAYAAGSYDPSQIMGSFQGAPLPDIGNVEADYVQKVPVDGDEQDLLRRVWAELENG